MSGIATSLLTVEQVPIDQLHPDPANPRRISDEELDSLERSIRQFGWHDPDKAEEAAEARRIGGMHRRKAKSVATIYDFSGLRSIESAQRLLETAAVETLGLENSIQRNRTLIAAAAGAGKLIEAGDLEERLAVLETAVGQKRSDEDAAFPEEAPR
jgi:hypothetical protein